MSPFTRRPPFNLWLIDWWLTPTLAIFQPYRGGLVIILYTGCIEILKED
jgi:hypothetical protein